MIQNILNELAADPWGVAGKWFALAPAAVLLLAAAAAVVARNLVRAALALTLSFMALGVLFISLGAEFLGFVQLMVYVGAVAMLIVFAILLTRPDRLRRTATALRGAGPAAGVVIGLVTLGGLLGVISTSPLAAGTKCAPAATAPVARIGEVLMGSHVAALLAVGVLLTAALVGAAILAIEDK